MNVLREANSDRLRASLRALIPVVVTLVVLLVSLALLGRVFETLSGASTGGALLAMLAQIGLFAVLIGLAVWSATRLEDRPASTFGLIPDVEWGREFLVGVAITLVGTAASLWWAEARGLRRIDVAGAEVTGPGGPLVVAVLFAAFACFILVQNVYEEVIYRRIVIGNLIEGLTARGVSPILAVVPATAVSAILFGAYHVPLRGSVVVAIDAALVGVTFALAYLLTGDLGFPIGIHFGRFPLNVIYGLTLADVEMTAIVTINRNTLAANMEVKFLRLGIICLLILAWVYWVRGGIGLGWNAQQSGDVASDAD